MIKIQKTIRLPKLFKYEKYKVITDNKKVGCFLAYNNFFIKVINTLNIMKRHLIN